MAEIDLSTARPRQRPRKEFCVNGHEMTPENTRVRVRDGYLVYGCRACKRLTDRKAPGVLRRTGGIRHVYDRCKRGHEFNLENTRTRRLPNGGFARECRACARDRWLERHGKKEPPNVCRHGHEYTPENTAMRKRGDKYMRACLTCERANTKKTHARMKERRDQGN